MASDDAAIRRLREALSALADREADTLVAEAQRQARERVRSLLTEALSESMLAAVERVLEGTGRAGAVARLDRPASASEDAPTGALYVYGVIAAAAASHLPDSLAGETVRTLSEGDLAAVVGDVDVSDYGEERLRAHLADMAWVERSARRHEAVLEAISAHATVIPMRMCTVYEQEPGLRALLRREAEAMREALAYLTGKSEWGVKAFCDPGAFSATIEDEEPARSASGAEYLKRRLREREERTAVSRRIEEAAARVHGRLCTVAADSMLAPLQRPEVSGREQEMVLNGVYLVQHAVAEEFHARVRALREEVAELGLELEETGPWPAYNFVPGTIGAAW
jgi:hypothetical protein